jgi:hypothetical protein
MLFAIACVRYALACRHYRKKLSSHHDDKLKHIGHYSYLSETTGSTFVALRPGM